MNWEKLLCEKRQTRSKYPSKKDLRNEFQKDYLILSISLDTFSTQNAK